MQSLVVFPLLRLFSSSTDSIKFCFGLEQLLTDFSCQERARYTKFFMCCNSSFYTCNCSPVFSELPIAIDLSTYVFEPEQILEPRMVEKENTAMPEIKVLWSTLPEECRYFGLPYRKNVLLGNISMCCNVDFRKLRSGRRLHLKEGKVSPPHLLMIWRQTQKWTQVESWLGLRREV